MSVNEDPILDIRKAVLDGMCRVGMQPEKRLIDAVVDSLPDFFRQPLKPVETIDAAASVKAFGEAIEKWSGIE